MKSPKQVALDAIKIKNRFISWDFMLSLCLAGAVYFVLPDQVPVRFTGTLYAVGISVLCMCIFYFLAVLALLVSSSDEHFLDYLGRQGDFFRVLNTYKYTLVVQFLALIYTLGLFGMVQWIQYVPPQADSQNKWWFLTFVFGLAYGIFMALESSLDSLDFLKKRVSYLSLAGQVRKSSRAARNREIPPGVGQG